MPHLSFEYSANLAEQVDLGHYADQLRLTAIETGVFPLKGVRVRGHRADIVSIADGDPKHMFLDLQIRLREGRSFADRQRAVDEIWQMTLAFFKPVLDNQPLAISLEMRNIDDILSPKINSIERFIDAP